MHPLKVWRRAEGLTQQQAAEAVERAQSTYNSWENLQRYPSPDNISKIERVTKGVVTAAKLHEAWKAARADECQPETAA